MDIVHFGLLVSFLSVTFASVTLDIYLKSRNNEREKAKHKDLGYSPFWCWLHAPSKVVSVSVFLQRKQLCFSLVAGQYKPIVAMKHLFFPWSSLSCFTSQWGLTCPIHWEQCGMDMPVLVSTMTWLIVDARQLPRQRGGDRHLGGRQTSGRFSPVK